MFLITTVTASIYDQLSKRDDYKHIKMVGIPHQIILCFSLPRNFKKLITTNKNSDGLDCLSGMKRAWKM
ncbi:hypothetical protein NQ315_014403 [Exocentrus adspersus]|uniref:Uncharacterized protein n=1 Tax=Exocentrus adspersus TaxID=1586481 RepID=A0AAV8VF90_9CUCU|nr:hypothetical protein NQ315_014403 [Exocentrus adspersus]